MRYRTSYAVGAELADYDGAVVSSDRVIQQLVGLACHSDSVLNYADLPFAEPCDLRGGHPRIAVDGKGKLRITVEVDSNRRLTRSELGVLREDFAGQITDGIGAGCFDDLAAATGLSVQAQFPLKSSCRQDEGTAWKPKASTEKGNQRRISAVAKQVDRMDSKPKPAPGRSAKAARPAPSKPASPQKPNFKKLFRLLAKPERDQLFDQIRAELEACGNDLSSICDREYPTGNFRDPKLLRLLLKAGLRPETLDQEGHSLLYQAAVSWKSIEVLLKAGVDVNRICDDVYRSTALHRAASLGMRKSVEALLAHGADASVKDADGKTALQSVDSRAREREAIQRLLRGATRG